MGKIYLLERSLIGTLLLQFAIVGCATTSASSGTPIATGLSAVNAAVINAQELHSMLGPYSPDGVTFLPFNPACETEQRSYLVTVGIPGVSTWVFLNRWWMGKVQENFPSTRANLRPNLTRCVRNPYWLPPSEMSTDP